MKKLLIILVVFFIGPVAFAQIQEEDLDAQYATELLKPGAAVPDFTLNDLRGKPRQLSEFRGKQVVLVSTVVAGKIAAALKSSAAVPAIGKKGVCTEEGCL